MSKKDYIAIADALRSVGVSDCDDHQYVMDCTIDALCHVFKRDNPRFNEARWRGYVAGECGPNGSAREKGKGT